MFPRRLITNVFASHAVTHNFMALNPRERKDPRLQTHKSVIVVIVDLYQAGNKPLLSDVSLVHSSLAARFEWGGGELEKKKKKRGASAGARWEICGCVLEIY